MAGNGRSRTRQMLSLCPFLWNLAATPLRHDALLRSRLPRFASSMSSSLPDGQGRNAQHSEAGASTVQGLERYEWLQARRSPNEHSPMSIH